MTDYTKPFPCGECDKMVKVHEKHTYKDCIRWKKYIKKKNENKN